MTPRFRELLDRIEWIDNRTTELMEQGAGKDSLVAAFNFVEGLGSPDASPEQKEFAVLIEEQAELRDEILKRALAGENKGAEVEDK